MSFYYALSWYVKTYLFTLRNKSETGALFEEFTMLPFDENEEAEFFYIKRRQNQGRTEGHFNEFYNELDSMLEEYGKAAHERRHSKTAYLPLAVSIPQLVAKVLQLLIYLPMEL